MSNQNLTRYDRSVADNIGDIENSFGDSHFLVHNFMTFINHKLKMDLFGYCRFTLKEFAKTTNIRHTTLSVKHPDIESGRIEAPQIRGFKFESVFDYALYQMYSQKLLFSKEYEYKDQNKVLHLSSISILKDIKLNFDWKSGELKEYEVRLSEDMLDGFMKRYYMIDQEAHKALAKGRFSYRSQLLLLYLCRSRHILNSQNKTSSIYAIDVVCRFVGIDVKTNKGKKQALIRLLERVKVQGGFKFEYSFSPAPGVKSKIEYYLNLTFSMIDTASLRGDHIFYLKLLTSLKELFGYLNKNNREDFDLRFQDWLTNNHLDIEKKIDVLQRTYESVFSKKISDEECYTIIFKGFLSDKE